MLPPPFPISPADLPDGIQPTLIVVIDTEEEFDWGRPVSPHNRSVEAINHQPRAQAIFDQYGIKPTYVVDYPVAETPKAIDVLRPIFEDGRCEIGAHLQPWVNPPYDETISPFTSYTNNLPRGLQHEKLATLTAKIVESFETRPIVYKAGRYGIGQHTADILSELGYEIDASVLPNTILTAEGGPDFTLFPDQPFWFGPDLSLFEIPLTRGFIGHLSSHHRKLAALYDRSLPEKLHLPGILARLGLAERITLTPEGISLGEQKRLTRELIARGQRVFSYTYHSSSLLPGGSPYVSNAADVSAFLGKMDAYFHYFFEELGGQTMTTVALRDLLKGEPTVAAAE
ncbi:MAG: polysaccharide deacetylase family protein [Pseudomonadota bacterium]